MTGGLVVIVLAPALVAGTVYFFWRLGGPGLEQEEQSDEARESPPLPYRRFEQRWRWGMLVYYFGLMIWVAASVLRLVPFTRLGLLACAVPFASMSLFGLYTGEITFRDSTVRREKDPIRFWLYFGLDTVVAGLIVYLAAVGIGTE